MLKKNQCVKCLRNSTQKKNRDKWQKKNQQQKQKLIFFFKNSESR